MQRDLKGAQSAIEKFKKNKQLPEFLSRNLEAWHKQLVQWQEIKLPDARKAKASAILNFAEKNLSLNANISRIDSSNPRYISDLVVSSLLYEFVQKQPQSPSIPEALYWLAVVDRELSNSPFYSLADLYLKECMLKFPETKTAMKCYQEYEAEMVFGYTGSGGTNVPREVLEDLKYLKKYVESKGKIPLRKNVS